jgi:hypothetical protein
MRIAVRGEGNLSLQAMDGHRTVHLAIAANFVPFGDCYSDSLERLILYEGIRLRLGQHFS